MRFNNVVMRRRRRLISRLVRFICGRRLPQTWNTVLVCFSIHMYFTMPLILAAGINEPMTGSPHLCDFKRKNIFIGLLRPLRDLQKRGMWFGEIDDDLSDVFCEIA